MSAFVVGVIKVTPAGEVDVMAQRVCPDGGLTTVLDTVTAPDGTRYQLTIGTTATEWRPAVGDLSNEELLAELRSRLSGGREDDDPWKADD